MVNGGMDKNSWIGQRMIGDERTDRRTNGRTDNGSIDRRKIVLLDLSYCCGRTDPPLLSTASQLRHSLPCPLSFPYHRISSLARPDLSGATPALLHRYDDDDDRKGDFAHGDTFYPYVNPHFVFNLNFEDRLTLKKN